MSLACVGADFPNPGKAPARRFEIALCAPADPVTLEHEPKNKADGNAIMVVSERGVCMGYIAADRTSIIHQAWRDAKDVQAIFQRKADFGAWIRIGIDCGPDLPPPPPPADDNFSSDADIGFYPDPEWPD